MGQKFNNDSDDDDSDKNSDEDTENDNDDDDEDDDEDNGDLLPIEKANRRLKKKQEKERFAFIPIHDYFKFF